MESLETLPSYDCAKVSGLYFDFCKAAEIINYFPI